MSLLWVVCTNGITQAFCMLTPFQLTALAQKGLPAFGLLQRKNRNRRTRVQTLLGTHGKETEQSSVDPNRAIDDDLYPLQIRSLIYKSRLPKVGWGSWSKYSCITPTLHHYGPKHHLQKQQQQLQFSWQLLMYEA